MLPNLFIILDCSPFCHSKLFVEISHTSSFFLVSHEDISSDSSEEADSKEKMAAISSPIRVTPERDVDRKNSSGSKWHKDKRRSASGTSAKLSVKDRLFVSRKTIGKTSSG